MFLQLAHTKLDIYKVSRSLVLAGYNSTRNFPNEERFGIVNQIRRAAMSIHLNISEGASIRSVQERKRYYEIARGSLVEVDTAFDISLALEFVQKLNLSSWNSW